MLFPASVQTAHLFNNDTAFADLEQARDRVLGVLNTSLPPEMPKFRVLGASSDEYWLLSNEDHNIAFSLSATPMDLAGFADLYKSALHVNAKADLLKLVEAHQQSILVEVGAGSIPFPTDHPLMEKLDFANDDNPAFAALAKMQETPQTFEPRIELSLLAALAIYSVAQPDVVHWGQSQQVFTPDIFAKFAVQKDLRYGLMVHPFLVAEQSQDPEGPIAVAINAYGAQHILKKGVIFAAHTQNWQQSFEMVMMFIKYCQHLGHVVEHGETFGRTQEERIRVLHKEPNDQYPMGWIELVLEDGPPVKTNLPVVVRTSAQKRSFMESKWALYCVVPFWAWAILQMAQTGY